MTFDFSNDVFRLNLTFENSANLQTGLLADAVTGDGRLCGVRVLCSKIE